MIAHLNPEMKVLALKLAIEEVMGYGIEDHSWNGGGELPELKEYALQNQVRILREYTKFLDFAIQTFAEDDRQVIIEEELDEDE